MVYEDKRSPVPQVYMNSYAIKSFTKNCPYGVGSVIPYEVKEGKYYSYISQEDADLKAITEISTNGQISANSKGKCAVYARVELKNKRSVNDGYFNKRVADLYVAFYYDNAGNSPATLGENTVVAIQWDYIWTDGQNDYDYLTSSDYITVPSNTSRYLFRTVELEGIHAYYDASYNQYFEENYKNTYYTILNGGSNYVTSPTQN